MHFYPLILSSSRCLASTCSESSDLTLEFGRMFFGSLGWIMKGTSGVWLCWKLAERKGPRMMARIDGELAQNEWGKVTWRNRIRYLNAKKKIQNMISSFDVTRYLQLFHKSGMPCTLALCAKGENTWSFSPKVRYEPRPVFFLTC